MTRPPNPITDTDRAVLARYAAGTLTLAGAAKVLGTHETTVARKAARLGIRTGNRQARRVQPGINDLAHARALARATLRDQAIVEILGGGCEKKAFATHHGLSPTTLRSWLLAFQHELAHPTPEEQAPAEGQERDTKDWAYHAVRRLKAQYPGVFD